MFWQDWMKSAPAAEISLGVSAPVLPPSFTPPPPSPLLLHILTVLWCLYQNMREQNIGEYFERIAQMSFGRCSPPLFQLFSSVCAYIMIICKIISLVNILTGLLKRPKWVWECPAQWCCSPPFQDAGFGRSSRCHLGCHCTTRLRKKHNLGPKKKSTQIVLI